MVENNSNNLSTEEIRKLQENILKQSAKIDGILNVRYNLIKNKAELAPASKLIGLHCLDLQQGFAHCELRFKKKLTNWNNTMHGGVTAILIDVAIGAALETLIDFDKQPVTSIHLGIDFVAPINSGKIVCAKAIVGFDSGPYRILEVPNGSKKLIHGKCVVIIKPERKVVAEGNAWFVVFG